ncbi:MAG: DUF692 domain-containing protein [Candidatus Melainabacteria bacterium]|nr:DUF692 domain-containing protein [Candidatus Melainabacteria bacterium]
MTKLGIGWRPEIALAIERRHDLEFVEVLFENTQCGIPEALCRLKDRGVAIIPHAVSFSLGGAERPDVKRLRRFNRLAVALGAPFVSEHIAFVRADNKESGHLLPVPRTKKALQVVVENVLIAREHLSVPLVLENIATICDWKNSEMEETEFISEILKQTGCSMLLDIANLYANSVNHGFNAVDLLNQLPLEKIAYVHTAGGVVRDGVYHDTHAHPVTTGVHNLLETLLTMTTPPRVMLERDDNFPDEATIHNELDSISKIISNNQNRMTCLTH